MNNEQELLKLLLPEYLIEYFDIIKFEKKENQLHLYFEEKSSAPKEFSNLQLQSKGFHEEITVDDFPLVDRFHVQKLAIEAVQELRIQYRWEAIDLENEIIKQAKDKKEKSNIPIFENHDTRKQLLARSRYLLYKCRKKWTENQNIRAKILFDEYPDLEKAYNLSDKLRKIYNQKNQKSVAMLKLAHWFNEVETSGFKSFSILKNTITHHYNDILNYFEARSTNASAESFNAKIKNFRLQLRGVKDKAFFLFRLSKLFA